MLTPPRVLGLITARRPARTRPAPGDRSAGRLGPGWRRVLRVAAARPGSAGAHRPVRGGLGRAVRAQRAMGGL